MKTLLPLALLTTPLAAIPASTVLTLASEPGFNKLTVSVEPRLEGFPLSLASSSTSTLTGSMMASFDVDNATGKTSELTLGEGRVHGSKLTLAKSVFLIGKVYDIVIGGISAEIFTAKPPGLVTPVTGQFDASQHAFNIDQGTVSGTVRIPGEDPVTIDESFSPESPITGTGSGTGTVTLTAVPSPEPELYRRYTAVLNFPVDLDDTFDAGGNSVAVKATGTIKASGTLDVPLSDYLAWTLAEGITSADGQADANGDGIPNAIAWALGLGAFDNAGSHVLRTSNGGYEIQLPIIGTIAPISIEGSDLASTFLPISNTRVSTSLNPLPPGSTGLITINRVVDEFLRLHVDE